MGVFQNVLDGIFNFIAERIKLELERIRDDIVGIVRNVKLAFGGLAVWVGDSWTDWLMAAAKESVTGTPTKGANHYLGQYADGGKPQRTTGLSDEQKAINKRRRELIATGLAQEKEYLEKH